MITPSAFRALLLAPLLCSIPTRAASGDLWSAARTGDVSSIHDLVRKGSLIDARDAAGQTPLMFAARAAEFGALRELLQLGADPSLATPEGRTALTFIAEAADDARACQLILRAYAFMKAQGRPAKAKPARPHLVLLFEPTVNYLHPALKPSYYVNEAELHGRPGVDDDGNGFVDDVYGWNLDANRAHEINSLQFQIYLQSRETIARLFKAYNEHKEGRLSTAAFKSLQNGYDNPLALIFGRSSGFTNGEFLSRAMELSHGSHVAGIIVEHSRQKALLHTLSWESFGDAVEFSRHRSPAELARGARDVSDFLNRFRADLLAESLATGRRLSDYVRVTGAGIVNMSMGADLKFFAKRAQQLAEAYLAQTTGPRAAPNLKAADTDLLQQKLREMAFECYIADAVQFLVPMFENPDVLFVIAAGNEGDDNDDSYHSPAYLSRFMANAITVAAVDEKSEEADFSNIGRRSVDLGAPGVNIRSTVIPEASVLMDGTSMAAPAVAGAAAYLRAVRPDLTAAELKKLIVYSAKSLPPLRERVSSGGVLDEPALFDLAGDARIQASLYAVAAMHAMNADPVAIPERFWDADWLSERASVLDPGNAEIWATRARAINLKGAPAEAVAPIERAAKLDANSAALWRTRGLIYGNLGNRREAIASYDRAIALAEKSPEGNSANLASDYANRAGHQLALGNTAAARADVAAARRLDSALVLSDPLKALLP